MQSDAVQGDTVSMIAGGVVLAGILIFIVVGYWRRRRRAKRRMILDLLLGYFLDEVPIDQTSKRTRAIAGQSLMRETELYPLVTSAFHGAFDAKIANRAHAENEERHLLGLLAALKREFGLTDRYQIEGWRPGRE